MREFYKLNMDTYNIIKDDLFLDSIVQHCSGIYILYNGETLKINHHNNINYENEKEKGYRLIAFCGNKRGGNPLIYHFENIMIIYKMLIDKGLHIQKDEFFSEEDILKEIKQNIMHNSSHSTEFVYCVQYFIPTMLYERIPILHPDVGEIVYNKFRCPELLRDRLFNNYARKYYDYSEKNKDCAYISEDFEYILQRTSFGFDNLMKKDECKYIDYLI